MVWTNFWVFKLRLSKVSWLLLHLLALVIVIALINLGLWQLRRLDERRENNELFTDRLELPILTAEDLSIGESSPGDWELRKVELKGQYITDDQGNGREAVVRNRTSDGRPGVWMLTPFQAAETNQVFVLNRGWVPRELSSPACRPEGGAEDPSVRPPTQEIILTGILRVPEGQSKDEQIGEAPLQLTECLSRVELEWLSNRAPGFSYWIQLEEYRFTNSNLEVSVVGPTVLPSPNRGDGPHLGYAIQWFIFATIFTVGYPLMLRQTRKKSRRKNRPKHPPHPTGQNGEISS